MTDTMRPNPAEAFEDDMAHAPEETAPIEEMAAGDAFAIPDQNAVTDALRERDEWRDKAYRAAAEAENVKRRAANELSDARQYAVNKFASDVLGVGDNLARALSAPEGNEKALREGILMVATQLQGMLGKHGIAEIAAKPGDSLNPDLHQAMSEVPSAEVPAGCILQQIQPGFTLNGRLLRPALVVIAKAMDA
ncbi:MAG: nucleotide exchange factor GrpE [Pseudomonas fluorescens]|nr:MAG: nucleotide exchange factor GrpE [Pseudomonas fluorescens]